MINIMEILLAILQENLALVAGGGLIIAAFARHMMTKGSDRSGPVGDYHYDDDDEREDWFMNPANDMGFFERHDD